jgi:two-component system, sensor histidine kinase PdtaS
MSTYALQHEQVQHVPDFSSNSSFGTSVGRSAASYERELTGHRNTEARLRASLAREEDLLREKDALIQRQQLLASESDHRLLNGLQMIGSLLSLQSRMSASPEAARQLAVAANRVASVARVHRRLHYLDGVKTVAFKNYLEDFCREFSAMLPSQDRPGPSIAVTAIDIELPAATAIPLGFIVNELITNAVKYGAGGIAVRLERNAEKGYALSVLNNGPVLPEIFDPIARKGLGLRIVQSLVERIGGELRYGPGADNQGARFTVLFA